MQFRTHADMFRVLAENANDGRHAEEAEELKRDYRYDEVVIDDAETLEEAISRAAVIVVQRITAAGNREAWKVMQKATWIEGGKGVRVEFLYRMVGNHA